MAYFGYVIKVENLRKHPNADKLQLLGVFGTETCVSLDTKVGDIGIYFPCDGQLSVEFCEVNNLVRKKDEAGNNVGGFLDPDKRNVRAIRLRGERSDGIYLPISCLESFGDITTLNIGDRIDVFNSHEICCKYIPRTNKRSYTGGKANKTRKHEAPVAPLFKEHADTEQLAYNLSAFRPGDEIEITLKMHGTSQRTAYLPVLKGYDDSWFCQARNWLWFWFNRITKKNDLYTTFDKMKHNGKPFYEYDYISGTRRVVLENYEGGFYGSNEFREQHSKFFEGKLWKGETVYYEVVGFTHTGAPIMAECANKKLNDPDFIKQYGETTVFSYGCEPNGGEVIASQGIVDIINNKPQSDIYVYRMTMTNEDGDVVEYTPDFMRYRCEQMGVKCVPLMWKGTIPQNPATAEDDTVSAGEWVQKVTEQYYDGPDPIGKTHVREGVVVRILNRPKFTAYKTKNYSFKVLEDIIKDSADAPDIEEAQEVLEVEDNI